MNSMVMKRSPSDTPEIEDADHVPMGDFPRQDQFLLESLKNAGMAGQFSAVSP